MILVWILIGLAFSFVVGVAAGCVIHSLDNNKKKRMSLQNWRCPCGFQMSDIEYRSSRFDYGCPRCGKPFSEFYPFVLFLDA